MCIDMTCGISMVCLVDDTGYNDHLATMNYLKSITSTVLSSAGVSYPFTIGERIPGQEPGSSIWELREGVKRVCHGVGKMAWH